MRNCGLEGKNTFCKYCVTKLEESDPNDPTSNSLGFPFVP